MKIFLLTHLFYLAVSLFLEEHKTVKIIRKEGPSKCCELFLSLRVPDIIRNRQILEQLLRIRSCVPIIALSNTSYTALS